MSTKFRNAAWSLLAAALTATGCADEPLGVPRPRQRGQRLQEQPAAEEHGLTRTPRRLAAHEALPREHTVHEQREARGGEPPLEHHPAAIVVRPDSGHPCARLGQVGGAATSGCAATQSRKMRSMRASSRGPPAAWNRPSATQQRSHSVSWS
jgi:hypothetical protein